MTSPIAGVYAQALVFERATIARVATAPSGDGPAGRQPAVSVEIGPAARGRSVAAKVADAREAAREAGEPGGPAVSLAARSANGSIKEPDGAPSLDVLA